MAFTSPLSELFASSPIKPMQNHMSDVLKCVQTLEPFMTAVFAQNWDEVTKHREAVSELEHTADEQKRAIRLNLPKGLFMAIDRRDLLDLLSRQDRIANKAKDITGIVTGRQLAFPVSMQDSIMIYVKTAIAACKQAAKAINELDELLTAGFRGQEIILIEKMIDELDRLENETDAQQIQIRKQLLVLEKDLPPIDVIFMYEVIDWMGDLADNAQLVGDRLELMVAR